MLRFVPRYQDASRPRRGPSPPDEAGKQTQRRSSFSPMCGRGRYRKEIVVSNSTRRLPARPSLEQLRKQAKELLRNYRADDTAAAERIRAIIPHPGDLTLADAHFVMAREYGFESWAHVCRHVEFVNPTDRLKQYERLARDIVTVCQTDDAEALQRLADTFGRTYPYPDLRTRLQRMLTSLRGPENRIADITL